MRSAFALSVASLRRARCLAAGLAGFGCTTKAENSPYFGKTVPPEGQHMRYISGSEPESLDPQVSSGQPEARLHLGLYDGLTEYHPETGAADSRAGRALGAERRQLGVHVSSSRREMVERRPDHGARLRVFAAPRAGAGVRRAHGVLAYYIKGAQAYNEGKGKAEDVGVEAVDDRTVKYTPHAAGAVLSRPGRASVLPAGAAQGDRAHGQAWTQPAEHRHERRVHAADVEAVRPARRTSATRTTGTRRT